ncbi:molybdate ABC transporter substrate-binding protein [Nocardiopsis sp. HNM0947]|uniref:Molybdate ABC transporter substrate-binding protein n=1 Tax=Nocardiopsis coralli TaxID=2772213 RepID=A0ABR9P9L5_9ACTN|nr:molybdate ABC transporter substrate-binding protein [Nocardiopsis coralli]MBE3000527.1 molybdate ABC transporter substrate-binding protein [Nocardiopsis coralli]
MPETPPSSRIPRRDTPALSLIAAATCLTLAATACGGGESDEDGQGQDAGELSGELDVFAAASLTDVFEDLAADFEAEHPDVDVVLNFAGSSELAVQINSGAPADVFAAADTATMGQVTDDLGLDPDWAGEHGEDGALFATNTLQIAVPPDNPAGIETFDDLAEDGTDVAFCADEVPCGAATAEAMEAAGTDITPVTYEEDVRAVLTKVELGEVDAGLVYTTDVVSAEDRVEGIDFPEAEEAVNDYPIGLLSGAQNPEAGEAWIEHVLGEDGAAELDAAGFGTP